MGGDSNGNPLRVSQLLENLSNALLVLRASSVQGSLDAVSSGVDLVARARRARVIRLWLSPECLSSLPASRCLPWHRPEREGQGQAVGLLSSLPGGRGIMLAGMPRFRNRTRRPCLDEAKGKTSMSTGASACENGPDCKVEDSQGNRH